MRRAVAAQVLTVYVSQSKQKVQPEDLDARSSPRAAPRHSRSPARVKEHFLDTALQERDDTIIHEVMRYFMSTCFLGECSVLPPNKARPQSPCTFVE